MDTLAELYSYLVEIIQLSVFIRSILKDIQNVILYLERFISILCDIEELYNEALRLEINSGKLIKYNTFLNTSGLSDQRNKS